MEWYQYPLAVAAGFVAGFINTLAGSGSAVTLPLLNAVGLPIDVANGTNRVAILFQNTVNTTAFHRKGLLDTRTGLWLAAPAVLGSVGGALVAGTIGRDQLRFAIGCVMLIVLATLFVKPKRWIEGAPDAGRKRPSVIQMLTFCLIGVYGGFVQIGVGVFLLVGLVLQVGFNLLRANAVKVFVVLCLTVPALAVFLYLGQVRWDIGLVLACGNMLGAWVATREAAKRGARFVRYLLIVVVSFAALKYLGVLGMVASLFRGA
jgi:uncharacterized membrane protein YfcA